MNEALKQEMIRSWNNQYQMYMHYMDIKNIDRAMMINDNMNEIEEVLKKYYHYDIKKKYMFR